MMGRFIWQATVELTLKAKICQRLGIPNLFIESDTALRNIPGIGDIRKTLKTHNLFVLLIFSGLKERFDLDKGTDRNLAKVNSLLFNTWDENVRYKPCGHADNADVQKLIELLSDSNEPLKWIDQN